MWVQTGPCKLAGELDCCGKASDVLLLQVGVRRMTGFKGTDCS